jgi:hypothetical protein
MRALAIIDRQIVDRLDPIQRKQNQGLQLTLFVVTVNHWVGGSIPSRGANKNKGLRLCRPFFFG